MWHDVAHNVKGGDSMADGNDFHIYVPEDDKEDMEKLKELGDEINVAPSRLIVACVKACLPTLLEKAPKERSFKLNGKTIII